MMRIRPILSTIEEDGMERRRVEGEERIERRRVMHPYKFSVGDIVIKKKEHMKMACNVFSYLLPQLFR